MSVANSTAAVRCRSSRVRSLVLPVAPLRVGPGDPVAQAVPTFGLCDVRRLLRDHGPALGRGPPAAVDLTDRHRGPGGTGRQHLTHLQRRSRGDDPHHAGFRIQGGPHRHDVRTPVGAQRGQRAQVPLGPELDQRRVVEGDPVRGPPRPAAHAASFVGRVHARRPTSSAGHLARACSSVRSQARS